MREDTAPLRDPAVAGDRSVGPTRRPAAPARARVRLALALLLVALMAWLFVGDGLEALGERFGARAEAEPPAPGNRAPTFSLPSAGGQTVSLASFVGQPVLINFWATWCVPCRVEMPELEAAYEAHRWQDLTILAVNVGEDGEDVVPFGRQLGLTFPLLLDPLGHVAAEYRVLGLPTTFFVGRDGRVTYVHQGALNLRVLEAQIERLVS